MGTVNTGSEHPLRENISHPSCPVPSSSNVEGDGTRQLQGGKDTGEIRPASHLHEEMVAQINDTRDKLEDARKEGKH